MTTGLKIAKNSFYIIAGNFLNKVISIILLIMLTGYLAPSEFGRYSFVISYVAFFGIFTDLGLNTLITREISSGFVDARKGYGHAIILRLLASVLTAALLILSILLLGYPLEVVTLGAAAALSLFFSFRGLFFRNVFDIPFQVHLTMNYIAIINFFNELLTLGVAILFISRGATLLALVLAINIANLPGFAASIYYSSRLIRPAFKFDPPGWGRVLKESIPLGGAALLEGVFIITPIFLLSRLPTEDSLGFFSLPFRLVSSLWIIPAAIMISLLPKMSRDAREHLPSVKDGFFKGLKAVLFTGLPIALFACFYSGKLMDVFTRGRYPDSAPALSIMVWGTLMYFINTVFFYAFTAAGKQRINTLVWSAVTVVSAAFCAFLIPMYFHMGAAAAFSASLGFGTALNIFFALRLLGLNGAPVLARFAVCGAIGAAALYSSPFNPAVTGLIGTAAYSSALVSMKVITYKDLKTAFNRGAKEDKRAESPPIRAASAADEKGEF